MVELKKYVPETVMNRIKETDNDRAIFEIKKKYLEQIEGRFFGSKFLRLWARYYSLDESDPISSLSNFLTLSKIYYLIANYFTCRRNHHILTCNEYNSNMLIGKLKKLENEYGRPIWEKPLGEEPILWNVVVENKDHYYLTFLHSNPKITYFDPVIQKFSEYFPTGIINFRIHLDHSLFIEEFYKDTKRNKRILALDKVKKLLNINNLQYLEIRSDDIANFDRQVEQVTHETRDGDEAYTSLTRADHDRDTRNEPVRQIIQNRPFRNENGIIVVNHNSYTVGLFRGNPGKIQFTKHLPSNEQIAIIHEILTILGWNI